MARTGLTNLVVWGLATFFLGYLLARGDGSLFAVAAGALAVASFTRFWPEGLGVAAGALPLLLMRGAAAIAVAVAIGGAVVWRLRGSRTAPAALPNGTSTPRRLTIATLLASFVVFVVDGFLVLAFGFTCQSDTSHATPGSDRAAWCDALAKHDVVVPVLFGPAALVFLAGIYAASRSRTRRPRPVTGGRCSVPPWLHDSTSPWTSTSPSRPSST
jgi:hypothetical protein